ncbi:MAG TPA: carbonic anhydrase [Gemmatimonadota bacterium]|nr:carbonic anhydrase [Gemmatimonadota bacterium]
MDRLLPVDRPEDVPEAWRGTPIERLLAYHNLGAPLEEHDSAEILIGMCMDNRKVLRIPDRFAFVIRAGGANLQPAEFKVSYAVAVGGVRALALVGHTHCGMVGLHDRRTPFVDGLVDVGWEREAAESHFDTFAPQFEIGDEVDFARSEAERLRDRYPRLLVAPLIYRVEDGRLWLIREGGSGAAGRPEGR